MSRTAVLLAFFVPLFGQTVPERAVSLLTQKCGGCHGGAMAMSSLRLDSREALLKGGTRGTAAVPGNGAQSRLVLAVSHAEAAPAMPPGKKLADAEIALLRQWVDQGAEWPQSGVTAAKNQWWAFQKPKRAPVPTGAANPIDGFLVAKLSEQGLTPSKEADRLVLIRRATYDLHGLPPTADDVRTFLADQAPDAYDKLIDRLLASPRYGEKWGRHWLDLVRYGDTSGFEQDPYNLEAWRYRDWVIRSFNKDKPYDRFIKEQIAGDELYPPEEPESVMGTGFFNVGANRDMLFKVEDLNRVETLTDFVDTTSSVFLGLSVGCARCHDHKFDPIPQKDYYRMQAIFAPFQKTRVFLEYNSARFYDLSQNSREVKLRQMAEDIKALQATGLKQAKDAKLAKFSAEVRQAFATEDAKRSPEQQALVEANQKSVKVTEDEIRAGMSQAELEKLHVIEKKLVSMFAGYGPPPMAPGLTDVGREAPLTYVAVRGNPQVRGERVQPGFLTALGGGDVPEPPEDSATTQRRKALALWMANAENPLTARVMVNRIWHYHFGRGIVATPSDYGTRGSMPTHPELLDWLATEFVQRGWSMKQMHKLIMTSAAYRRSAEANKTASEKDPQNIYLSHFSRRRLEAEELRDSILQASGNLNLKMEGVPVVPPLDNDELYGIIGDPSSAWVVTSDAKEHNRRSVYLITRRAFKPPMFELFDSPDGILSCSRRESSTIAPQSLTMLNGRFTVLEAKALAAKIEKHSDKVGAAWRHVLGRDPSEQERAEAAKFLAQQTKNLGNEAAAVQELARGLFNINEFLYVD